MEKMKNERGFGLLEVIIASSLLGLLLVGVLNVGDLMTKTNQKADQSLAINSMLSFVGLNFSNPISCKSMMRDVVFEQGKGASLEVVMDNLSLVTPKNNKVIILADKAANYGGVKIANIRLVREEAPLNDAPLVDPVTGISYNNYLVRLNLDFERQGLGLGAAKFTRSKSGFASLSTANGTVLNCSNSEVDPGRLCESIGGTWSASSNPKCDFGAGAVGTPCGLYFESNGTVFNCKGVNPINSCPPGFLHRCWKHGGKYAVDRQCSCFKI